MTVKDFTAKLRETFAPEKTPGFAGLSEDRQVEEKFRFDAMVDMCELFMEKLLKHEPFLKSQKEAFADMDKNKDGVVSVEEFGSVMREQMAKWMPVGLSDELKEEMVNMNVKHFFGSVDLNKDGFVSLDEFLLAQAHAGFHAMMSPTIITSNETAVLEVDDESTGSSYPGYTGVTTYNDEDYEYMRTTTPDYNSEQLDRAVEKFNELVIGMRFLWVFLLCFTGVCAGVGVAQGTCKSGTPDFLYYSICSIMALSFFGQLYHFIGEPQTCVSVLLLVMYILLGLADMLDFFTDGQQISLAVLCDEEFHDTWVAMIEASVGPWSAAAANRLHMYGLLIISLVATLVVQASAYMTAGQHQESALILATYVGVGGAPYVVASSDASYLKRKIKLAKAVSVGLFENIPGFFLQTSLFCLTFDAVDDNTRSKQLISLALCEFTSCTIIFGLARALYSDWGNLLPNVEEMYGSGYTLDPALLFGFGVDDERPRTEAEIRQEAARINRLTDIRDRVIIFLGFCYIMLAGFLSIYCPLRIYFAYTCPDHLWNLTTGCWGPHGDAHSHHHQLHHHH